MKKTTCLVLASVLIVISGCAGVRPANPVSEVQFGDNKMTCEQIRAGISVADTEVLKRQEQIANRNVGNGALGIIGFFFLWPIMFAMDFSTDEQTEIDAWRNRKTTLQRMQNENCG